MGFEPQGRTTRRRALAGALLTLAAAGVPRTTRASVHQVQAWPADKPVPPLSLVDLNAKSWTLAALRGRVVLVNFWASWCEPCRAEMPSLQRLQARLARQGVTVLTVNYKEGAPQIQRFLDAQPLALPVLLDTDGAAAAAWTPHVFPSTVLIDRSGTPRTTVVGALDWNGAEAQRLLRPLLTVAAQRLAGNAPAGSGQCRSGAAGLGTA